MCGRYHFLYTPEMQSLFAALGLDAQLGDLPNLAPTDDIPIILEADGQRECHLARWWLTPSWSKGPDTKYSMFNARAENLESSRAFKGLYHHKRCVVPASAFIEWQVSDRGKRPLELCRSDHKPLLLAGLWDVWSEELLSCAIITCEARGDMRTVHSRMPVMLAEEDIDRWLSPSSDIGTLSGMLHHPLHFDIEGTPIDRSINNASNKASGKPTGKSVILTIDNNAQA